MDNEHIVFLGYATPDRERVFGWYDDLTAKGFNVWMDKRRLKGGQNWDFEIKRVMQKATIIVVFLSKNSVDRRGYAQREIKAALDQARDKLVDDIYLIPVILDPGTPVPVELERIQVISEEDGDPVQATAEAITTQLERLGAETIRIQGEAELRWTISESKDCWDGLPGYDIMYHLPRFNSEVYSQVSDITDVLRGWLVSQAMSQREIKFDQSPEHCNFRESKFRRQNSWEASCGDPKIKERVVCVTYSIWWYGAGAAHPNFGFQTFSFTLDPVTQIKCPEDIFDDAGLVFPIIQKAVRDHLLALSFGEMAPDERPMKLLDETVLSGTENWTDFSNFVFAEDGIDFLFGAYQVAPYAFGPQSALVPYETLAKFMKKHYASALGIEHLRHDGPAFMASVLDEDAASAIEA